MQCSSTSGQLPAVDLEHMKLQDAKKINKLIRRLKEAWQGNGQITLIINGGKIADVRPYRTLPTED